MPEKIRRVRRKRRSRSLPGVESFPSFRLDLPPVRVALYVAAAAVAVLLLVLFGTYGSKLYAGWHESRLLKRATTMLEKKDFVAANRLARQVLEHRRDSLPAFYILAEATEKQNSEQTVSWRAQVARLQPDNIDSQLNLASAALRFSQIDLARKTLERPTQAPEFHTGSIRALLHHAVDRSVVQTADRFAQQLQMAPEVSVGDYLLCLNF